MIQVCYEVNTQNIERGVMGFVHASREVKAEEYLILTMDQEQELTEKGLNIAVKPVWEWLLTNENEA
ncbi:MAG: ATP-binding protein, partial [Thermoplasmataceae archaeon]